MASEQVISFLDYMRNDALDILAKPNAKQTKILSWDVQRCALRVDVHAPPEDNKANVEIIKFFSRLSKKRVRILVGLKSKRKTLQFF